MKTMIQKIHQITEIDSHISPDTLVALDLDNTLIHSTTHYGSVEWEEALVDQFIEQGMPLKEAFSRAEKLWAFAQRKIQVRAIEKESAQFIQQTANICPVIGLTARSIDMSAITHQGLYANDIAFSSYEREMDILHKGVLYCCGSSVKAQALSRFIDEILPEKKMTVKTILIVDDKKENLEIIASSPLIEKFTVRCFHYLYAPKSSFVPTAKI